MTRIKKQTPATENLWASVPSWRTLTYHREPNSAEIAFGYGATHYMDVSLGSVRRPDGSPKAWFKDPYGNRWYY